MNLFKSFLWVSIDKVGVNIINLLILFVLMRLLSPEDFGIIGILTFFVALSSSFLYGGFSTALIQNKDAGALDFSTIFIFSIFISIAFYIILFFTAPLIASYFQLNLLKNALRVLSLIYLINAFSIIQLTYLQKELKFSVIAKANLISTSLSGIIAITLAFLGFKYWSIVVFQLSSSFFTALILWFFSGWRPALGFNIHSIHRHWKFGFYITVINILDTIAQNIIPLIIAKIYTTVQTGYYTQAKRFSDLPAMSFSSIVMYVLFPAFSLHSDNLDELRAKFRSTTKILSFINFPLMFFLAAAAEPLFKIFLTEKWDGAIFFFQILCLSKAIYFLHAVNVNIVQVRGRGDIYLFIDIIKKILFAISIVIGLIWGLEGLVFSQLIGSYIAYFINASYTNRLIGYSIKEQLKDVWRGFYISNFSCILTFSITLLFSFELWITLFLQILIFFGSFIIISILVKSEEFIFLKDFAKDYFYKLKNEHLL